MQVVEKVGYIIGYARLPTCHLGGSGGMLPRKISRPSELVSDAEFLENF